MDTVSVHNKLQKFAPQTISLKKFQDLLESSSRSNPIRVQWETLEGNTDYYWMYWDSAAYVGNEASDTKAAEGMFNIQCLGLKPKWRTLDLQTVSKCRFENQLYLIR
jgi:hypothetical protein